MDAKTFFNIALADVQKALAVAKAVEGSVTVKEIVALVPSAAKLVAEVTADTALASTIVGAIPELEAAYAVYVALGGKPNQDLDHVGPGRAEMRDGGVGPS